MPFIVNTTEFESHLWAEEILAEIADYLDEVASSCSDDFYYQTKPVWRSFLQMAHVRRLDLERAQERLQRDRDVYDLAGGQYANYD